MQPTRTRSEAVPLLEINDLRTHFFLDEGTVRAVDGVSLAVGRGETLGIVGESGCGKSITARSVLQIVGAGGRIVGGEILFRPGAETVDLARYPSHGEQIRRIRGNNIAMVFQEPMTAFSPVYTVGRQIAEAVECHRELGKRELRTRVLDLLDKARIPNPQRTADSYPFELSGGMLQRAMIAMALACDPVLLIADEPTTALDVTVQAQILELLRTIQAETGMAIIMISHNMGVIAEMADVVAVMYLGKVVEQAPLWDLFDRPQHPYTRALLKAIPMVEDRVRDRLEAITGDVPSPYDVPSGCSFHPRCEFVMAGLCADREPVNVEVTPGHAARCFLLGGRDDER